MIKLDLISKTLYDKISKSQYPLSTEDISKEVDKPNYILLNKLKRMAIEKIINGKQLKNGGVWIWWLPDKPIKKSELDSKKLRLNELKNEFSKLQEQLQSIELEKEDDDDVEIAKEIKKLKAEIKEKEDLIAINEEKWTVRELLEKIDSLKNSMFDIIDRYMKPKFKDMNAIYEYLMEEYSLSYGFLRKYFRWEKIW